MYPTMHFPDFLALGGGMYDSKCDPDRKVIPKKTQIGLTVICAAQD